MTLPALSPLEARALGVLVEKQHTVPDAYPLTLNALVSGCNQKTSRDPVMAVTESEVLAALDRLKADSWIVETSGGRVMRYAHNVERVLRIPSQSAALLATLMLRGPQTPTELRANSDRLHRFADASAVEAFLRELADRQPDALAVELPRAPGARETRWMERLSDAARNASFHDAALGNAASRDRASATTDPATHEIATLRIELAGLRRDIARLRDEVAALSARLPAAPPS